MLVFQEVSNFHLLTAAVYIMKDGIMAYSILNSGAELFFCGKINLRV